MHSIPELTGLGQPAEALVEQLCTTPEGQRAIARSECLWAVIQGYPVILRRFYRDHQTQQERSATHRIVPDDVPAALLALLYGDPAWLPAGMVRVYGTGDERQRITLQRLCVLPEYAPARRTRCVAYDFDGPNHSNPLKDALGSALATHRALTRQGVPTHLVRSHSGQGYHLWGFLETELDSRVARHLATHWLAEAMPDAEERAKVEINPKWHDANAQGFSLTLPWHAAAPPGHNTLIDPTTLAPLDLPPSGRFQRIRYDQICETLLRLPPVPSEEEERRAAHTASARTHAASGEFSAWAQQVCGNEALIQQVYGPYLTGRQVMGGLWLECRDPASPTGDRTPSARVNSQTGSFRSFRGAGRKATLFEMMVELGHAPSKAAAIRQAEQAGGVTGLGSRGLVEPYGSRMLPCELPEPAAITPISLDEARRYLASIVRDQLVPLVQQRGQSVSLIQGGTGIGKSTQFGRLFQAIARGTLRQPEGPPLRAVYVTHSRAKIDELVDEYLSDTPGRPLPGVVIAYPRSPDPKSPGYCARYQQAKELSECQQSVKTLLCIRCKKETRAKAKAQWDTMTKAERRKTRFKTLNAPCPYQQNREAIEAAQVVVGVRHSFQHGGSLLEGFDLIVIDEQSEEAFFQTTALDGAALSTWEHRMTAHPITAQVLFPVLSAMKQALVAGPAEGEPHVGHAVPLLPVLQRLDPEIGTKLSALQSHLDVIKRQGISPGAPDHAIMGTFVDMPSGDEVWEGAGAIPMRGLLALVDLLAAEVAAGRPIQDTRVWLRLAYGDCPGRITLVQPRARLIASLQQKVTVFLDATAYLPVLDRLFGGTLAVYAIPVQTNARVTFFGDALYRWKDLTNPSWRREAVLHHLRHHCRRFGRVLVMGEVAATDTLTKALPPHVEVEHWFSGEMAGSNRYEHCEAILCLGHPREPIDGLVVRIAALRWPDALAGTLPETTPDLWATEDIVVPVSGFRDGRGRQWGRVTPYPVDPEIRNYALHRYATTIIQAVGRIRATDPERTKEVFLYTGEPPQGLAIDRLLTLERALREDDPAYLQAHPYRRKPRDPITLPASAKPDRTAATFTRYLQAGEAVRTAGLPVTIPALQAQVGGSLSTAARYHPRVLETLAVRQSTRQALAVELHQVVTPEHVGQWAHLAYQRAEDRHPDLLAHLLRRSPQAWEREWLHRVYYGAYQRGRAARQTANSTRARLLFAQEEDDFRRWATGHQHLWEQAVPADPTVDTPPPMTEDEWTDWALATWWGELEPEMAAAVVLEQLGLG